MSRRWPWPDGAGDATHCEHGRSQLCACWRCDRLSRLDFAICAGAIAALLLLVLGATL